MSRRAIHLPKLGFTDSVLDIAPLYCGKARDDRTLITIIHSKATCARCRKANALAHEDLEYRRVQARLQRQRDEQVSP